MTSRPLLEVENLGRTFDVSQPWLTRVLEGEGRRIVQAVNGVSFSIARGETFALVGESGSGKSTIARMCIGLLRPSGGSVRIDGVDIWNPADRAELNRIRRRVQMIFQDPYASLNPRWRVDRIIAEPLRAFRLAKDEAEIEHRVAELLKVVRLDPLDGRKFPHEFSGGQRQRIAVARALANRPDFIVCDEPTSALDVSVQAQILNLMRDLQDEFGLTYLLISHNLAVVRHMASRIGVLYLGRLAEAAPARDLFRSARHPYTRMLLDAVPDITMAGREREPLAGEAPNPIRPPSGCTFHPRCPQRFDRCDKEIPAPEQVGEATVACHAAHETVPA